MAQKAFMADAGIRLGEWSIVELANGDLQVSNVYTLSGSQKLFRVDKGLRIGDWRMTVDDNGDMNLSETAITGSQRPFIADGGVRVGEWTLHATQDGDLFAEKNAEIINYNLSCNYSTVDEGDTLTITLTTTGIGAGTIVPYTISGVDSADIGGASLTGNFVVGTTDSITLNITSDTTTEGEETLQISLDGISAAKTIPINDTSTTVEAQDASAYNWNVTTTIDHPTNLSNIDTNNYDDANYQAQLPEGDTMSWTATTDAPDGTTVYFTCVSTYYGSYDSAGDPNWNDISGDPGTSGTLTVLNGQVSATITAISDNTAEDGELRQVWLMPEAGDYGNILARSQWFHIADPSGASGGGGTAPAVGTWMYGGETIAPGWWETEWNGSNTLTVKFDTSSTSTAGWGTTNDQWEYVLDDWAAGNGTGDTIEIRGDGGLRVLTINGSVTKTQIGSSDTYYYAIPVSVTTGTMPGAGYIVTPLYLQHQYNG